jgi:hypothetical protein
MNKYFVGKESQGIFGVVDISHKTKAKFLILFDHWKNCVFVIVTDLGSRR